MLICDMWHPNIDIERDVVPTLLPDEKDALEAARCGKHLPLKERHYTTGKAVKRDA